MLCGGAGLRGAFALHAQVDRLAQAVAVALRPGQRQAGTERPGDSATPPRLARWTERYPFLQAAVGARLDAPTAFDAATAVQMLFEKTDQTLVAMQIKNKPI